ncbi:MAG: TetR/AcrR family transcriptional regulator [Pseudomonadota bacterium]
MTDSLRPAAYAAIIEAAFELLVENPGAALGEIAKRAGVGRATLHRYFSSRDDLILALTKAAIREMDEAVEVACKDAPSYSDALYLSLGALLPLGDRYRFMATEPLEDHPEIRAEFDRQEQETFELVENSKKEGLFDPSVPTAWIAQSFEYLLYAAWESVTAKECTPAQANELAWRTLTKGLGAKP